MSMSLNEDECYAANLDPAVVKRMANKLDKLGAEFRREGLAMFCGEGSCTIRPSQGEELRQRLVLAHVGGGNFDGGANACKDVLGDGLERGE